MLLQSCGSWKETVPLSMGWKQAHEIVFYFLKKWNILLTQCDFDINSKPVWIYARGRSPCPWHLVVCARALWHHSTFGDRVRVTPHIPRLQSSRCQPGMAWAGSQQDAQPGPVAVGGPWAQLFLLWQQQPLLPALLGHPGVGCAPPGEEEQCPQGHLHARGACLEHLSAGPAAPGGFPQQESQESLEKGERGGKGSMEGGGSPWGQGWAFPDCAQWRKLHWPLWRKAGQV